MYHKKNHKSQFIIKNHPHQLYVSQRMDIDVDIKIYWHTHQPWFVNIFDHWQSDTRQNCKFAKKIVITSKLGFELVGIYRVLFFLVQDLQFALRRAGQNPTDVEVALC